MPIKIEEGKTPRGTRMMHAQVSGHVSLADAQGMGTALQPGQPYHQALVLCTVEKGTEYSPESRKYFNTMTGNYKRLAIVVTSAVVRAAINFMTRISGHAGEFRMFTTAGEALAWLDES